MPNPTPWIFAILSVAFGAFTWRDVRRHGRLSPAGRAWLRVALIFGAVALWLWV